MNQLVVAPLFGMNAKSCKFARPAGKFARLAERAGDAKIIGKRIPAAITAGAGAQNLVTRFA